MACPGREDGRGWRREEGLNAHTAASCSKCPPVEGGRAPGKGQNLTGRRGGPRTVKGPGERQRCLTLGKSPGNGDGRKFMDYLAGTPSTLDI